jgi:hypothetical protein
MKRETLTSVLYYTFITIGILTTVVFILHIILPDGFFLVNSILERPFFAVDANTSDFHIYVLLILIVASWAVYAVSLATCFMFPSSWGDIYDFLSFLYPKRKPAGTCSSNDIRPTEEHPTIPVRPVAYDKIFANMPLVKPDIVFADSGASDNDASDNDASDTPIRHFQSTITDLPHVARVISGTEVPNRILYVYNVVTGECGSMSERELYSKTKKY